MDKDVGMTILCKGENISWPHSILASLPEVHKPRTSPRATFAGLILQAISYIQLISSCSNKSRHYFSGNRLISLETPSSLKTTMNPICHNDRLRAAYIME